MKYHGKNILSFKPGTMFRGAEIKEWIRFYLENDSGTKSRIANAMRKYLNIDDNQLYELYRQNDKKSEHYGSYIVFRVEQNSAS